MEKTVFKRCECGTMIGRRLVMCNECFEALRTTGQPRRPKWIPPSDGSYRGQEEVRLKWEQIKRSDGD